MARAVKTPVKVTGRELVLTNLEKVLWPDDGITKAELIEYYTRMAPTLLPYLRGRPLVITRYPDGIAGKWFYQKDAPPGTPEWVRTWPAPSQEDEDRTLHYIVVEEPATLTLVANLGAIELHPWLSRCRTPDFPDWAVIDLDPAEGATFQDVLTVARLVRRILEAIRIQGYPKLSGATGIHIFCPCGPRHSYRDTAGFCEAVGRVLLRAYPEKVTLERAVAKRAGKVYVDYLQNRRGQTITSVYGIRPLPGAPVSAPITWEEVEGTPPRFTIRTIWQRLKEAGDLCAPMLGQTQDLHQATVELSAMI